MRLRTRSGRRTRWLLGAVLVTSGWAAFDTLLGTRRITRAIAAPGRERTRSIQRAFPVEAGDTVMLGDSITADGDWRAALPDRQVRNRGISGDTTADLLERLDESLSGPPDVAVILIGTNDLEFGVAHAQTVRNTCMILDRISATAPGARVVLHAVLPRSDRYNTLVAPLNTALARVCGERDIEFLDLTVQFSGPDNRLEPSLTDDGLHPNGAGHQRWAELLREVLES
jgi:lysophospholipase L1-like esterase